MTVKKNYSLWILSVGLLVLSGCAGGGGSSGTTTPPPPTTGSVTGTLSVSNIILPASATVTTQSNATQADIVPGEIIVRFKNDANEKTALAAILNKFKDVSLGNVGPIYPNGPYLLRTNAYQNKKISTDEAKKQTLDVILKLKNEPNVQYAEPNGIVKSQMIPNNSAYIAGFQWDMGMINLPTAWEMTTGSSSVIVAVLDSGIRSHPNLDPNVLATGYNFVDMNSDPTEPLAPTAKLHGTHVAGTIAAIGGMTGSGIAGVAWNVKIMPVRVLGAFGGTDTMIINGMLYAAGLPNLSGKIPPQRANVINMSLTRQGACSQSYQDVINQVINAGVTLVAAAGNEYLTGSNPSESPASCQGVIAVGAVDPDGNKASYSGSQPYVFIAAPGGEISEGIHAGVLSTLPISTANGPYYKFMQGTSMSTPHISGVVALMYSVNSSLTTTQIRNILASTANSLNTTVPNNDIGYGLVDAGKAVAVAKGVPIPAVAVPYPDPSLVNFQQISTAMMMTDNIVNMGASTLVISGSTTTVINPVGGTWLSASLDSSCSSISQLSSCPLTITVDPSGLTNGQYIGDVILNSNGGNFGIPVTFQVGATPSQTTSGPITVQLWNYDPTTSDFSNLIATTTTDVSHNYNYTFQSVPVGSNYVVVAGNDKNGDGVFGDYADEGFTTSSIQPFSVVAGQASNIDTIEVRNELDDIISLPQVTYTTGTWLTMTPMPTPRDESAVGTLNNVFFVIGGTNSQGIDIVTVESYNPVTNDWTTKASMPTAREGAAAGVINNILYVVGGWNSNGALATVEAYDPTTDTWTSKASMPIARYGLAIAIVNNIIYAVGGHNGISSDLATVEAYDPTTDTWVSKASMPTARSFLGVGVVNNILYALGGFHQSGTVTDSEVEAYNPGTNTWATMAPMPTGRGGLAVGTINNVIYSVGGWNSNGILSTVEAYNPVTNTWTSNTPMPIARLYLSCGVINNTLYAIGGRDSNGNRVNALAVFRP